MSLGSNVPASGKSATALGYYSSASGTFSTSIGSFTNANGWFSNAMGSSKPHIHLPGELVPYQINSL